MVLENSAKRLSKSKPYLKNSKTLLKFPPDILNHFEKLPDNIKELILDLYIKNRHKKTAKGLKLQKIIHELKDEIRELKHQRNILAGNNANTIEYLVSHYNISPNNHDLNSKIKNIITSKKNKIKSREAKLKQLHLQFIQD